jgi:7-cyano-7-deazaguanine synthase
VKQSKAIVLLSGGLDSTTSLYWALKEKKWDCQCLLFDYGQRHVRELKAAAAVAWEAGCPYRIIKFDLPWGGSSLLGTKTALPIHALKDIGRGPIPSTYVPARNTIFLSFALSWADALNAENIVLGANALDYSGYPDCRPNYFNAFQKVAKLGTRLGTEKKRPLKVWAPLLRLTKTKIIRLGMKWGVPYEKTWSCYKGTRRPCGVCDSCRLRQKGFKDIGQKDPLLSRDFGSFSDEE